MTGRPRSGDPDEAARSLRTAWEVVAGAAIADLVLLAWAANTWLAIGRLQRGEVQILADVWEPVAWMYELGGPFAAMVPFVLLSMVATVVLLGAALRVSELRPRVTRESMRRTALADYQRVPSFLRHVDETGAIPRRTIVLLVVLALLLAGMAVYVIRGRAELARVERERLSAPGRLR